MKLSGKVVTVALLVAAAAVGLWAGNAPEPIPRQEVAASSKPQASSTAAPTAHSTATFEAATIENKKQETLPQVAPQTAATAAPEDEVPAEPDIDGNPYHRMQESLGIEPPRSDPSSYADRALQIQGEGSQ